MIQTMQINPNVSLSYIPMEWLKTTTLGIYIHRPLKEADASMNALLPYVLKRGCGLCKNTTEMAKYLENLYGASLSVGVVKKGDDQILAFDAESISDCFAPNQEPLTAQLCELLLSILTAPVTENGAFCNEFFTQEQNNAIDRAQSVINDKRTYAGLRCLEEMCKGEAAAISKLGTVEGLRQITPQSLYAYYQKLLGESVIDVFICGQTDIEKIRKMLATTLPTVSENALIPSEGIFRKNASVQTVTDRMDVTQGKLSLGLRTNIAPTDERMWGLIVGNSIFGAGAHSKLFNNVREKLSLCYYASSQLEKFKGLMFVNAGIEFENFQKAYDEILVQLDAVKKGDISDFELESSINALLNTYESAYDDQRMLQGFYLGERLAGTDYEIADYIEHIRKVTKEDVVRAMQAVELDTVYFLTGKEEQ